MATEKEDSEIYITSISEISLQNNIIEFDLIPATGIVVMLNHETQYKCATQQCLILVQNAW